MGAHTRWLGAGVDEAAALDDVGGYSVIVSHDWLGGRASRIAGIELALKSGELVSILYPGGRCLRARAYPGYTAIEFAFGYGFTVAGNPKGNCDDN